MKTRINVIVEVVVPCLYRTRSVWIKVPLEIHAVSETWRERGCQTEVAVSEDTKLDISDHDLAALVLKEVRELDPDDTLAISEQSLYKLVDEAVSDQCQDEIDVAIGNAD